MEFAHLVFVPMSAKLIILFTLALALESSVATGWAQTDDTSAPSSSDLNFPSAQRPGGRSRPAPKRMSALEREQARELQRLQFDESIRKLRAARLAENGIHVDWTKHSKSELSDMLIRVRKSQELKQLGYNYSWDAYSSAEMDEKIARARILRQLEKEGVSLDLTGKTLAELEDIESKRKVAERLRKRGVRADWQTSSLRQLQEMEKRHIRLNPR